MRFSHTSIAGFVLAASLPLIRGQTSTQCNPTKKSCPADPGLSTSTYSADFTQGASANASWSAAAGTNIDYGSDGAVFTIAKSGEAPTIETDFYFFFGRVDVVMKAATGTGIVSSIVLLSDDLDEIDWEFLGGSNDQVQSNFYGKDNTTSYDRVEYLTVADTQGTWHTYSIDWTRERINWIIDGTIVRTLEYSSALAVYGKNYPQTPMRLKLGNWAGGDSDNAGTVTWAGGKTSFSQAPFNMYVKSVKIKNNNPACSYKYGDETGSYESIKLTSTGNSCSADSSSSLTASGSKSATSSQVVEGVSNTKVAVSSTISGSAYSTNTASISAVNAVTSGAAATATGTGVNGTGTSSSPSSSTTYEGAMPAQYILDWTAILSLVTAIFML